MSNISVNVEPAARRGDLAVRHAKLDESAKFAARVYSHDGFWVDIVLGGSSEWQAETRAKLAATDED
jgi:hypothetical protein